MRSIKKEYKNKDITVFWKPSSCIHASACVNELPLVFNSDKRPWVNMSGASTPDIIEVVDMCPVDALMWKWNDEEKNETVGVEHPNHVNNRRQVPPPEIPRDENVDPIKVKVRGDGPLIVNGQFYLERENGTRSRFNGTVSLCCCGKTKLSPFCDGSHRDNN